MSALDGELAALEQRVARMTELVNRLRDDNLQLRQQQVKVESENAALRVKVDAAMHRLQRLIERLPEETA